MDQQGIAKVAKRTAISFQSFLQAYVLEALDIEPFYPGDNL